MKTETALLIIDMQNDFLLPGKPLYVDGAMQTVPQIKNLLDYARVNGWTVIHIIREHDKKGFNADKPRRYLSAKTQEIANANIFDMKNMGIECIGFEELKENKFNIILKKQIRRI